MFVVSLTVFCGLCKIRFVYSEQKTFLAMAIVISVFLHSQTRDIALNSKKNTSITAMRNTFLLTSRSCRPTQLSDKPVFYRSVWKLPTQYFGERVMRHAAPAISRKYLVHSLSNV